MIPGLRPGCRFTYDRGRRTHAVLYPEGVLVLDEPSAAILSRCDGSSDIARIVAGLAAEYDGVTFSSVRRLLDDLVARHVVADGGLPADLSFVGAGGPPLPAGAPIGMVAELTYRCPLRCTYCSNPVTPSRDELDRERWLDVIGQAAALGVRQLHLSGGEPLLRRDLTALVAAAGEHGLYTNLITSGMGLSGARLAALVAAGLRHVQLSFQDTDPAAARAVAGLAVLDRKRAAAAAIRRAGLPLTVNVVLHAGNVDRIAEITELAREAGASRLELAHTQFYGWALRNRATLLPSRAQVDRADAFVRGRSGDDMEIVYVRPDHLDGVPKPCMQGWGSRQLVVAPNGDVLPCHAAAQLPGPPPPSVTTDRLDRVWYESELFNRFRGTGWLPSPCRDCALREVDFGGCRCQAFQLTGDPAVTDPACRFSPQHHLVAR